MKNKKTKKRKIKKKKKRKIKKEFLILIILLLIGFSLRVFLSTCYYWDELIYLQHSEIMTGKINNYNELDFRPPLLSVMIAGFYLFWHNSLIANIFVTLLATFSILLIYLVGKEMFNKKVALIAAFLLTFWPIHIYFSKTLLVHTTPMFFALLSLLFLKKAENEKKGKTVLFFFSGIFIAACILTRFTYLILIPLIIFNIILFREKYNIKKIVCGIIGLLLVLLPYLIWSFIIYGNFLYTFKTASLIVSWSTVQSHFFYLTNSWIILGFSGFVGLSSWFYFKIKDKKITRNEIFLLSWILLSLLYLSLMPHKEIRFLIVILIPLVLFSSIGFVKAFSKIKPKYIFTMITLIIIFSFVFLAFYNPYIRTCNSDPQEASKWIMTNTDQDDIIYAQEEFTALAYYTDRKIILAPFNKTRFFDQTANYMASSGYYIYFEKQGRNEMFPTIEEITEDLRFDLLEIIKNKEKIYIYKYEYDN